jgi:hypothetical protein
MKTVLFIIGIGAAFFLSQSNKMMEQKQTQTASAAYNDSIHEAGRVEMMRNRMK